MGRWSTTGVKFSKFEATQWVRTSPREESERATKSLRLRTALPSDVVAGDCHVQEEPPAPGPKVHGRCSRYSVSVARKGCVLTLGVSAACGPTKSETSAPIAALASISSKSVAAVGPMARNLTRSPLIKEPVQFVRSNPLRSTNVRFLFQLINLFTLTTSI